MKQKIFFKSALCLCVTAVLFAVHVSRVEPAWAKTFKLGKGREAGYLCQEGHSGANLIGCEICEKDADCKARGTGFSCNLSTHRCQECASHAHCSVLYNGEYKCATNNVCAWSECAQTSDCTNKYGQLHKCVTTNGIGLCNLSCNYSTIAAAGRGNITLNGTNYTANQALNFMGQSFNFSSYAVWLKNMSYTNFGAMNTCLAGAISYCPNVWNNSSINVSNGNGICLPCSIQSGGAWGVGNNGSVVLRGSRPYYISTALHVAGDRWWKGVSLGMQGFGGYWPTFRGCCNADVLNTSKNDAQRLKGCIFAPGRYDASEVTNYQFYFGSANVKKVELYSPECALNQTGYQMVVVNSSAYDYCTDGSCILMSAAWSKVYLANVNGQASDTSQKWYAGPFSDTRVTVFSSNVIGCGVVNRGVDDARHWKAN